MEKAREATRHDDLTSGRRLLSACLDGQTPAQTRNLAQALINTVLPFPDPEMRYWFVTDLTHRGHPDLALAMLKRAVVDGRYCAYDALRNDPLYAPLRGKPEFNQLVDAAKQCRDEFIAQTASAR